jgi:hypothetical protein
MTYGVGLVFDSETESHISGVWAKLAQLGYATPLARPGCLPHMSLILSETLCVDDLAHELEGIGPRARLREVQISTIGIFTEPELVLFYGFTPTDRLLRLHATVERVYRRCSSTTMARTQSGVWVPHCTLATQLGAHHVSAAVATAATLPLPRAALPAGLAVVEFDRTRVELLQAIPWQTSPTFRRKRIT